MATRRLRDALDVLVLELTAAQITDLNDTIDDRIALNGAGATIGGAVGDSTAGSLLFVDSSNDLAEDADNLNWDTALNQLFAEKIKTSRLGTFGAYDIDEVQNVWSISDAFQIDVEDNDFGNMYGIAYSYGEVGGGPFVDEHTFYFVENGVIGSAIGTQGRAYFKNRIGVGTVPNEDDRVTVFSAYDYNNSDSFNALILKTGTDSDDLNVDGGVIVKHAKNFSSVTGYAHVLQVYAEAGMSGIAIGSNNFVGMTDSPYAPTGSDVPNGYIRFELGPIWPNSEKMRLNNQGDLIVGWTAVKGVTATQSGTTVTATSGTFAASDVGKFIRWTQSKESVVDKITAYGSSTQVTVETTRTIATSQVVTVATPKALISKDGNVAVAGTLSVTGIADFTGNVGINTTTPQVRAEIVNTGSGVLMSIVNRTLSLGQWTGIHLGYGEAANSFYRKGALAFEITEAGDGRGTMHFLINNAATTASAGLSDSKFSVTKDGHAKIVGNVGFNNTAPIAKPTVTGSRGSNAALASLLTALVNYGLITDSSS